MSERFTVGDRVRVVDHPAYLYRGREGTVVVVERWGDNPLQCDVRVRVDGADDPQPAIYYPNELRAV